MGMAELREQLRQAKQRVLSKKEMVLAKRRELMDTDIAACAQKMGCRSIQSFSQDFSCCRTLQGHTGKIYSMDWDQNKDHIVSASQDGCLIVWNAFTQEKIHVIKLACPWMMTCAYSPSGYAVACGGLDNVCSVYTLSSQQSSASPKSVLSGHKAYISCCKYVTGRENQILTSSGDKTCALWDSTLGQRLSTFGDTLAGHSEDVMSLSVNSNNPEQFVSGSCDRTAQLWDLRCPGRAQQIYWGHEADVNSVQFFLDGPLFGTGSEDGTCRIFDTRTGHELQQYKHPDQIVEANSIAFSHSGRLLFAAYSNADCYVWDTLTAKIIANMKNLTHAHTQRISCLGFASDGALCTGSWDQTLKIWANGHQKNGV
ncbi:hypothetical protein KP509_05G079300 [Ceratopteris richardii]|uniref:Uncharacterized protein n=1 Tax=Ceratopteris richardii TaxID=49495 RepID=A0A8T2UN54_CERRI|nr:hypothetical protein KP509_05G079300 [Ceratopteris richardii]KAH7437581.1 hypothetical protein KP509_05G079300 [Ceratopteris richardii]